MTGRLDERELFLWPVTEREGTRDDACTCPTCMSLHGCTSCNFGYRQVTIVISSEPGYEPQFFVQQWHGNGCPEAVYPAEGVTRLDLQPKVRNVGPRNRFDPISADRGLFLDTSEWPGQTWLYRAFDEAGELLYVGITGNVSGRMRTHRRSSPWWDRCNYLELAVFKTRAEAAGAERRAIRNELPRFNIKD
jgi:hypothetical protein